MVEEVINKCSTSNDSAFWVKEDKLSRLSQAEFNDLIRVFDWSKKKPELLA